MYRINYRNVAIIVLTLFAVFIFYKDPAWVIEFIVPDHFQDQVRPNDSLIFVLCLLGVILVAIIALSRGQSK